ncbi:hypothetical protein CCL13_12375 [Pseudomonas syringae]|nr:hypothetical protein CCL13_12375 [Pseudomonas syringae]
MQGLAKRMKDGCLSVSFATGVEVVDECGVIIDRFAAETMGMAPLVHRPWSALLNRFITFVRMAGLDIRASQGMSSDRTAGT